MINGIIYKATNKVNGKVYIGQTVKTLEARIIGHLSSSRSGKYPSNYFFRAMNKYGEDAFQWEEIDHADTPEELNEKEIYWIDFYNSNGEGGYNLTDGGHGVRGYKVTEEGVERRRNVLKEMWANGHGKHFPKGEDAVTAKHTNEEVRKIGEYIMNGINPKIIQKELDVSLSMISGIKRGKSWSHLFTKDEIVLMKASNSKGVQLLIEKDILELKDLMLFSPLSNKETARIYNISETSVYNIQNSKKWSYLFSEEDKEKIKKRGIQNIASIEDVIQIKKLLKEGRFNQVEIAWIINGHVKTVGRIKRGESFAHVKLEDEIPENENP